MEDYSDVDFLKDLHKTLLPKSNHRKLEDFTDTDKAILKGVYKLLSKLGFHTFLMRVFKFFSKLFLVMFVIGVIGLIVKIPYIIFLVLGSIIGILIFELLYKSKLNKNVYMHKKITKILVNYDLNIEEFLEIAEVNSF